jgi:hypothetical protein
MPLGRSDESPDRLAVEMSGPMQGHVELVIAIVGLVITVVLVALGVVALVARRSSTRWFAGAVVAVAATMGVLSFV